MFFKKVCAKDGSKSLCIRANLITKRWSLAKGEGEGICLIPSDKSLVKKYAKREEKGFLKALREELEKSFRHTILDLKPYKGLVFAGIFKERPCEKVELEVFALARLASLYLSDGFLIDLGRRKTTFLRLKEGVLDSYRVVLRGGDYLSHSLAQAKGISFEEAERLKRQEGLSVVKEYLEEILKLSGYSFEDLPVLLTGGGSRLKGIDTLFKKPLRLKEGEPEFASALGACLREVLPNPYPDFEEGISPQVLKGYAKSSSLAFATFLLSLFLMHKLYDPTPLQEEQRKEFKRLFPNEPIVSLYTQVRAKTNPGEDYKLSGLLRDATAGLKEGIKVYRYEYYEGRLTLRGEAKKELLEGVKASYVKQTPTGTVEFEIKVP